MNKKEVLEIRKQFTPENCAITRIVGCYVDHEQRKEDGENGGFSIPPRRTGF